eukprot:6375863-Lingulodinium_polyedra.AAC.1
MQRPAFSGNLGDQQIPSGRVLRVLDAGFALRRIRVPLEPCHGRARSGRKIEGCDGWLPVRHGALPGAVAR